MYATAPDHITLAMARAVGKANRAKARARKLAAKRRRFTRH